MKIISATKIGTIVNLLMDGQMIKKEFGTKEDANSFYRNILEYKENPTEDLENQILTQINKRHRLLKGGFLEYSISTGKYYLKNYNFEMPELLGETIEDYLDNDFPTDGLVKFWKWLIHNPDTHVREGLFKFLSRYNFSINDEGYFVAYKGVVIREEDKELNNFIEHAYKEIKSSLWKSNPSKYVIYLTTENEYGKTKLNTWKAWEEKNKYPNYKLIGNVQKLYNELEEKSNVKGLNYTDKWTGTMNIVLGERVLMNRDECDNNPDNTCASGLHIGSTKYAQRYVSKTQTVLAVLVNPMHVVSIPNAETDKMRVCEYFPFAIVDRDENDNLIILEEKYFNNDYTSEQIEDLEDIVDELEDREELNELENVQLEILKDRLVELKSVLSSDG